MYVPEESAPGEMYTMDEIMNMDLRADGSLI